MLIELLKEQILNKEKRTQFIRYVIVGFSGFLIEYSIFWAFLHIFSNERYDIVGISIAASTIANSIAMFIVFWYNFLLNRKWSFKSESNPVKQVIMQATLFVLNMIISSILIDGLNVYLHIIPQISKILVMGLIVCWNFILYKKVIFI